MLDGNVARKLPEQPKRREEGDVIFKKDIPGTMEYFAHRAAYGPELNPSELKAWKDLKDAEDEPLTEVDMARLKALIEKQNTLTANEAGDAPTLSETERMELVELRERKAKEDKRKG